MTLVTIAVEESEDRYSTWTHVFQSSNTTWLGFDTRQIQGNFFIGLQGQTVNIWNAKIPPGSTILSATMEVTAANNSAVGTHTPLMNSPKRSTSFFALLPFQKPFELFEGWRKDRWSNQNLVVTNSGAGTIADATLGVAGNTFWQLNFIKVAGATLGHRDRMAQRIRAGTGGGDSQPSVATYQMQRFGNPGGFLTCTIQGSTTQNGQQIPDETPIATSSALFTSTIPTGAFNPALFVFINAPALVFGQEYFFVIEQNYPTSGVDYISIEHLNQFFQLGQLFHHGEGLGNDWQNAPGDVEANIWHDDPANFVGADVAWPMPQFVFGVTYTSPDITALIQSQIDDPGYKIDAGIVINVGRTTTDTTLNRIWSSNLHATNPGPVLRVTYDAPRKRVRIIS